MEYSKIEFVSLKDVVEFRNGKGHEQFISSDGKYIVVNAKFISTDGVVKKYSSKNLCPIKKGDVLIVMSDLPNGRALAKTFLAEEDDLYTLNQRIGGLTIKDSRITPKFLKYILNRNKQYLKYDNGVDQTNLKKEDILNIIIPIPSISEQNKITEILDKFSKLEAELEAELEARHKQYDFWRGKIFEESAKKESVLFGDVATIVRGASPRPIKNFITNNEDGIPWIKIGDVKPGEKYINSTKEKITKAGIGKSRFVKKGDFILSNSMSFGRPYILNIDGCIHDGWLSISNFENKYTSDFLYHLLNSNYVQNQFLKKVSVGAVSNLNADIVKAVILPVFSFEEQNKIVEILDKFDKLINDISEGLPAEIEARRKQYDYYRNKLLSFGELYND